MSVASTTKPRGTRSEVEPTSDRAPEKREEENATSVAELAYRIYEERGRQEGHDLEDWLEAERRIAASRGPASMITSEKSAAAGSESSAAAEATRRQAPPSPSRNRHPGLPKQRRV
ncbi:MAG: DUF2934 domain-containing protein [bacterium]